MRISELTKQFLAQRSPSTLEFLLQCLRSEPSDSTIESIRKGECEL